MQKVQKSWYILFGIIFVWILGTLLFIPVMGNDDYNYAQAGNPFLLQWNEYLTIHGRYITHTLSRIVLQQGFFWGDLSGAFLLMTFFILSYHLISPYFFFNNNKKDFFLFLIWINIVLSFQIESWTAHNLSTILFNYRLSNLFILMFLVPYIQQITNKDTSHINIWYVLLTGFLAGSANEQSIAVLPALLLLLFALKYRGDKIESWYYWGLVSFILGATFLLVGSLNSGEERSISYGRAETWEFMGQTLNWVELGAKRYFYGFIRHLLFGGAAYLLNTLIYWIVFFFLMFKTYKIEKNFLAKEHLLSLFFALLSLGTFSIMMFSPMFHQHTLIFSMIFLILGIISYAHTLAMADLFPKLKMICILICIASFIVWLVQIPAWGVYRKEHNDLVMKIEQAKAEGRKEVVTTPFSQHKYQTPLGTIIIVFVHQATEPSWFYHIMAQYYGIENIREEKSEDDIKED